MKLSKCASKIEQDQLDYIVIDQFAKREVYQHYALSALPFPDKTKFETKGESKSSNRGSKHYFSLCIC